MNDKLKNVVVTIVFVFIIVIFLIANIIKKDDMISVSERRKLEQFPQISVRTLLNGTFFDKFNKFTTDQFVKREEFRKIKINTEFNLLKKSDYNNLYEYEDYIINRLYPLNEKSVANFTKKINQIYEQYLTDENDIYFTVVPDKNYFIDGNNLKLDYDKLESILTNNLSFASYIRIFDELELEDYYKTDTHWKQEKLSKIAQNFAKNMNVNLENKYEEKVICDFQGTYSGQLPISNAKDKIKILTNTEIEKCKVYNYETNEETLVYDMKKVNSLDKYDIYLSGATPLLKIENPESKTNRELIVFRDSYASSIVPLLIPEYSTITLIDTRYISPKLLPSYVDFSNQDVLFMYSTLVINDSYSLK